MWEFAANLTMLWTELDTYDRFAAAANRGFRRVELLFPQLLDVDRIAAALEEYGLSLVLFDASPGNWEAGERGILGLPGRERELQESIEEAIEIARLFGTKRINILAGVIPDGATHAECVKTAIENLRQAAPKADRSGLVFLIEPLNPVDVPGYLAPTVDAAADLIAAVGSSALRMQFDLYHAAMAGHDPVSAYSRHAHLIEHVQIADVPGRHEPGTGAQRIQGFLGELDRAGYAGSVGLEYAPSGTTEESFAWLAGARR